MEVTERKRGPQKNGGKIGSGNYEDDRDFKRQACLQARKTFILKISKNVSSKIKQILVKYIANLR